MASMHFRAGTVAIVCDGVGRVLVFERTDRPGQWQLPQGGLDVGEAPVDGVWRELGEETGLGPADVELVGQYPEWTAYEWPDDVAKKSNGRLGQAQRWFVFRIRRAGVEPVPDGVEFGAWRWADVDWLVDQTVAFRRPSYEQVLNSSAVAPLVGFGPAGGGS